MYTSTSAYGLTADGTRAKDRAKAAEATIRVATRCAKWRCDENLDVTFKIISTK